MRNFRKIFAFILCVVLLAALSISASAKKVYNEVHSLPDDLSGFEITGGLENPGVSGVMISTTEDGYYVGVRLWVAEGRAQTQSITIYDVYDAPVLVVGPIEWTIDTAVTGWQTYYFDEPLAVGPNDYYAVVISNGNCTQASAATDGFMSAIHGLNDSYTFPDTFDRVWKGFSWDKDVCPSNWSDTGTYLVDVAFVTEDDYANAVDEPETTQAPEQPTQAPEQPTQAPEQPTQAPETNVQTGDYTVVAAAAAVCICLAAIACVRVKKNAQ